MWISSGVDGWGGEEEEVIECRGPEVKFAGLQPVEESRGYDILSEFITLMERRKFCDFLSRA